MPKPIINFDDFLKDVKELDAVAFMQKWGIEKNTGKQILDGLWLDRLMSFTNKTEKLIDVVIIHELAHHICIEKFGDSVKSHGKEFRKIYTDMLTENGFKYNKKWIGSIKFID